MLTLAIAFLVLLNPFALFIYLQPVMHDLGSKLFLNVLFRATLISFVVFFISALFGEVIFEKIFQIHFEAFRIFGGIIIATLALHFIIQGKQSLIVMKEDLDDLASEIALPFMVGAATIALSIVIGQQMTALESFLLIAGILAVNYIFIAALMFFRETLIAKLRVAFDKNMEIFLRINAFFVGAIGLNMIITGINTLYF